ncbi:MAG: PIG-L family deacetylase [Candidatus Rokubacteria bacterium]|nr:PIG-L family deacetylase [Candidatus Rokubacteria bacterium]
MNILAVGAHPDDIEFGCGGTLIKYALKGHDVHLLVLTDGGRGGDAAERRREQDAAAKVLGAQQVVWGGYRDTEVPLDRSLIQKVESVLHLISPTLILTPFGDDTHQDHRHLSASVVTASRYTRNVLFYEGPTTANFTPSVFVDINAVLERKLEALRAHASQVTKTGVERLDILDLARAAAHFRGIQGRVRNAEGFVPLRLFINVD